MTADLADEQYCYLTTTGRVTGKPHEIEIWFALDGGTIYLLSDDHGSDWVRNLRRTPEVTVRIAGETFGGRARVVEEGGGPAGAAAPCGEVRAEPRQPLELASHRPSGRRGPRAPVARGGFAGLSGRREALRDT